MNYKNEACEYLAPNGTCILKPTLCCMSWLNWDSEDRKDGEDAENFCKNSAIFKNKKYINDWKHAPV